MPRQIHCPAPVLRTKIPRRRGRRSSRRLPAAASQPAAGLQGTRQAAVKSRGRGAVGDHDRGGCHLGCYGSCSRAPGGDARPRTGTPCSPHTRASLPPSAASLFLTLSCSFFRLRPILRRRFRVFELLSCREPHRFARHGTALRSPFVRDRFSTTGPRGQGPCWGGVLEALFSTGKEPTPRRVSRLHALGFFSGPAFAGRANSKGQGRGAARRRRLPQRSAPPQLPHPHAASRSYRATPRPAAAVTAATAASRPAGPAIPIYPAIPPEPGARGERPVHGARGEAGGPGESRALNGLPDGDAAAAGVRPGVLRGRLATWAREPFGVRGRARRLCGLRRPRPIGGS